MNAERKLTLIYFVLGLAMGILSNYLSSTMAFGAGTAVYALSFLVSRTVIGEKKKLSWYVLNTLLTFVLVWMITWIFLFNL